MSIQRDYTYTWTFKNVKQIWQGDGKPLMSASFTLKNLCSDTRWRMITEINQNGTASCESLRSSTRKRKAENQYISLYLINVNQSMYFRSKIINVKLAIIHPLEGQVNSKSKIIQRVIRNHKYGFSDFMMIDQFEELGIQDLRICCTIHEVQPDFESYKPLLCNKMLSDVKISIGRKTYPAHKLILSMSSDVFRKKFSTKDPVFYVKISDVKPEIFKKLLEFMYTGTVNNLKADVSRIFPAASLYQISSLQQKCTAYLLADLKGETVVSTLLLCQPLLDTFHLFLQGHCLDLIANNLEEMIKLGVCKDLGEKDPNLLRRVFSSLKFNVRCSTIKRKENSDCSEKSASSFDTCHCFETFEKFLNNKKHSDVRIHVGNKKFYAHKLILSSTSPVFCRMFEHKMKETISGVVKVEDIEPAVFYKLLCFMYTKKLENIENIESDIFIAANKYDVDELKIKVENILLRKLTIENVWNVLMIADRTNSTRLKDESLHFIIDYLFLRAEINSPMWKETLIKLNVDFLLELLNKIAFDYSYSHFDPDDDSRSSSSSMTCTSV